MKTFSEFGLDAKVIRAITEMGFEESTPIQEKTIPIALEGRDLIGQAQTGTGKTAAFAIPLIQLIDPAEEKVAALIMCPTRELAIQVAEEIGKLARFKGVNTLPIYGGQDIGRQIRALRRRPHIVIGTPGRLQDHIDRKTLKLDDVRFVVLDEADEMLDMGFLEDIQAILSSVPEQRHTMLFSATMPLNIQKLAQQFLKNPEHVSVVPKQVSAPLINQSYIEVHERSKFDALCRLLDMESPELAIIFGRTKRRVDELTEALQKRGYSADGLHGDLSQNMRDAVMRKFRDGSIDVLVATDVAARGLDVSGVTHVVNFDLPQDPESYVHRIGRTGRAGKEGTSWTFVTPREIDHLHFIEKVTRHKIPKRNVPTVAEAVEGKQKIVAERILEIVQNEDFSEFKGTAIQMLEQFDSVHLIAAAMKLLTGGEKKDVEVELTPEDPIRAKKRKPDIRGSGRRVGGFGARTGAGGDRGPSYGSSRGGYGERRYGGGSSGSSDRGDRKFNDGGERRYGSRDGERSSGGYGSRSGYGKSRPISAGSGGKPRSGDSEDGRYSD